VTERTLCSVANLRQNIADIRSKSISFWRISAFVLRKINDTVVLYLHLHCTKYLKSSGRTFSILGRKAAVLLGAYLLLSLKSGCMKAKQYKTYF